MNTIPSTSQLAIFEGVALHVDGTEPSIDDIDLGKLAEMSRPRQIRRTVRTAIDDGAIELSAGGAPAERTPSDAARAWVELEVVSGNPVQAFRLNEAAALVVLTRLRTRVAVAITRALVRAFLLARRGMLSGQRPALPPADAFAAYDRANAALAAAVESGAVDARGAALARLALARDVLGVPIDLGALAPAPAALALPPGPGRAVIDVVNGDLVSASSLGRPLGLTHREINTVAEVLGDLRGRPEFGAWLTHHSNGRETGRYWGFNKLAVDTMRPRLLAASAAKLAKTEAAAAKRGKHDTHEARKGGPS